MFIIIVWTFNTPRITGAVVTCVMHALAATGGRQTDYMGLRLNNASVFAFVQAESATDLCETLIWHLLICSGIVRNMLCNAYVAC